MDCNEYADFNMEWRASRWPSSQSFVCWSDINKILYSWIARFFHITGICCQNLWIMLNFSSVQTILYLYEILQHVRNPWNTDDPEIPQQPYGKESRLKYVGIILWGLVVAALATFYVTGTGAFEIIGLFRQGALSIGVGLLVLGVGTILFKILKIVGIGTKLIFRLFYLIIFVTGFSIFSSFVL